MTPTFYLLGAQEEIVPAIWITGEDEEAQARDLRNTAKTLHGKWLASGDKQDKRRFAKALLRWGRFVGEQPAVQHAKNLLAEADDGLG